MARAPRQPHADTLAFLRLLWEEGDVREVRVPRYNQYGQTAAGWFDSPEKLALAATAYDGIANIYISLNPVAPALLARANNRINANQREASADTDVARRRVLFLDVDPVRPSGISSTDEERCQAENLKDRMLGDLRSEGWPEPIVAMSGNGYYLLFGLDLPEGPETTKLVKAALEGLSARYSTPQAHLDTSVFNAARIAALIGTLKMKGEETEDRRHRRSALLSAPAALGPVSAEQLAAVARPAMEPRMTASGRQQAGGRSLTDILNQAGIAYRVQPPDTAGITWYHVERCPFHDDGRDFECGVGQKLPDGPYAGKCFHPEGSGEGWQGWKRALGLVSGTAPVTRSTPIVQRRLTDFHRTDSGNAELFAHLYSDRVRYDHRRGRWLLWDEHRWSEDQDGTVYRLAKEAVRQRYFAALAVEELDERTAQSKFAIASENRQRLEALLQLARNEVLLADAGDSWDPDPMLLGVANGVVDLHTGVLRDGRPEDRITCFVPVRFDPTAECPRWLQFLREAFADDEELIDFIHKAVGYSVTGDVSEQGLFICHGAGSNGKSVFLAVVRNLAGQYAYNAPFSTFEMRDRASIPNDVAPLAAKRLVTAAETNDGTRINEARIKALTGGDPITARFLNREFFTFVPQAKYWLAVNHRPRVDDLSHGFWRRVRLIPFTRTFVVNQDRHLAQKLQRELPGILAWAVRGCLAWQRDRLPAPQAVVTATEEYRAESDPLAQFIDECCVLHPNARSGARETYLAYQKWCVSQGMREGDRLSLTSFGTKVAARFERKRSGKGNVYVGLGFRSERDEPASGPTQVQGLVQGSESGAGLSPIFPDQKSLTREDQEIPCTTLHPTHPDDACGVCGGEVDSFASDGSPSCRSHGGLVRIGR